MALADFRNLEFLNEFVTEGGQIVHRSKSKLQAKVHRHLARQIKTARVMALLPHAGRTIDFRTTKFCIVCIACVCTSVGNVVFVVTHSAFCERNNIRCLWRFQVRFPAIKQEFLTAGRLRDFDRGPVDFADDDFDPDGTVNDSLPGWRKLMDAE